MSQGDDDGWDANAPHPSVPPLICGLTLHRLVGHEVVCRVREVPQDLL